MKMMVQGLAALCPVQAGVTAALPHPAADLNGMVGWFKL
jgi:hypothetical protein